MVKLEPNAVIRDRAKGQFVLKRGFDIHESAIRRDTVVALLKLSIENDIKFLGRQDLAYVTNKSAIYREWSTIFEPLHELSDRTEKRR